MCFNIKGKRKKNISFINSVAFFLFYWKKQRVFRLIFVYLKKVMGGWEAVEVIIFIITVFGIVSIFVHILCRDYKILNEKKKDEERISRIFYNLVTRKVKNAQRENLSLVDKYQYIASASGACEALSRIFSGSTPSLSEIISSKSEDGISWETMMEILGKHEDFLRFLLIPA